MYTSLYIVLTQTNWGLRHYIFWQMCIWSLAIHVSYKDNNHQWSIFNPGQWLDQLTNQEILRKIMKITSFLYFRTLKGKEKIRKSGKKKHTPYKSLSALLHCLIASALLFCFTWKIGTKMVVDAIIMVH